MATIRRKGRAVKHIKWTGLVMATWIAWPSAGAYAQEKGRERDERAWVRSDREGRAPSRERAEGPRSKRERAAEARRTGKYGAADPARTHRPGRSGRGRTVERTRRRGKGMEAREERTGKRKHRAAKSRREHERRSRARNVERRRRQARAARRRSQSTRTRPGREGNERRGPDRAGVGYQDRRQTMRMDQRYPARGPSQNARRDRRVERHLGE